MIEWKKRLEDMILNLNQVDAIKCLRHQNMNVEEATIGQIQRRNMFLINVFKRAKAEEGSDIRSFMRVQ